MPQVYSCSQSGPLKLAPPHDPNAEEFYTFYYRPRSWLADAEVFEPNDCAEIGDTITPTVPNGFVYECLSSGITGAIEPDWPTVTGETVTDGTVEWKTLSDTSLVRSGDTITNSEWEVSVDATLSDDSLTGAITYVKVSDVPLSIADFILTNRITILRENGFTVIKDRSLKVKVKET